VQAHWKTRALEAAVSVDLFSSVQALGAAATSDKVAEKLSLPARSTRILLDFLTAIGFFHKANGVYSCTPSSATFLVKSSPAYMGGMVGFMLNPALEDSFKNLTAIVKAGHTLMDNGEGTMAKKENKGHEVWVLFAKNMAPMAKMAGPVIASMPPVMPDANAPLNILDIAAGHGYYGISFLKANKQARVTFQDWAPVVEVALENAKVEGVADRCDAAPGSAFDIALKDSHYDLVLLTNFMHHFDTETNVKLCKRLHTALKPSGRLVTVEFVVNEDRVSPPPAAMFALAMLASTVNGEAYPFSQLSKILSDAGFPKTERVDLPFPGQAVLVSSKTA